MPIAFGATESTSWNFASTATITPTISGSNRMYIVTTLIDRSGTTLKDVQHNSVRMSAVATQSVPNFGTLYMHSLVAPSTTGSTVAEFSNANARGVLAGANYTGVDQTTPLGSSAQASGTSTSASTTVTSATGETVVDCMTGPAGGTATDAGAGQTERHKRANAGFPTAGSDEAGASSVTMSWTLGSNAEWAIIAVPMKADAGAVGDGFPVNQRMRNIKVPNIGA